MDSKGNIVAAFVEQELAGRDRRIEELEDRVAFLEERDRQTLAAGAVGCELCGDVGSIDVQARCHPSAPLRVILHGPEAKIELRCYVHGCDRFVGSFDLAPGDQTEPEPSFVGGGL